MGPLKFTSQLTWSIPGSSQESGMYVLGSNIALHKAAMMYYKVTACRNWIKPSNPMAILGHQTFHQKITKYYELESDNAKKKGRNITNWHPTSPRVFRGPPLTIHTQTIDTLRNRPGLNLCLNSSPK